MKNSNINSFVEVKDCIYIIDPTENIFFTWTEKTQIFDSMISK